MGTHKNTKASNNKHGRIVLLDEQVTEDDAIIMATEVRYFTAVIMATTAGAILSDAYQTIPILS
jgi:hypothetical protein